MKTIYFTLTGTMHRFGHEFLKPGMTVRLIKEPDNEFDKEAIRVELAGLGQIGYVANSAKTVLGDSFSAGRLYDKIGEKALGEVLYILPCAVLCILTEADHEGEFEGDDEKNILIVKDDVVL